MGSRSETLRDTNGRRDQSAWPSRQISAPPRSGRRGLFVRGLDFAAVESRADEAGFSPASRRPDQDHRYPLALGLSMALSQFRVGRVGRLDDQHGDDGLAASRTSSACFESGSSGVECRYVELGLVESRLGSSGRFPLGFSGSCWPDDSIGLAGSHDLESDQVESVTCACAARHHVARG